MACPDVFGISDTRMWYRRYRSTGLVSINFSFEHPDPDGLDGDANAHVYAYYTHEIDRLICGRSVLDPEPTCAPEGATNPPADPKIN
jgi:hypothetical protein